MINDIEIKKKIKSKFIKTPIVKQRGSLPQNMLLNRNKLNSQFKDYKFYDKANFTSKSFNSSMKKHNRSLSIGKRSYFKHHRMSKRHLNLSIKMDGGLSNFASSLWNGKKTQFTNSFNNTMYEDTRINSMKIKFRREINQK